MTPDDRLRLALVRAAATYADELWLLALVDRLAAEVERMRPVCDAAIAMRDAETRVFLMGDVGMPEPIPMSSRWVSTTQLHREAQQKFVRALAAYRATLPRPAGGMTGGSGAQDAVRVVRRAGQGKGEAMNMTIGKEFRFEAAHSLPHLPAGHKCARPHGHSYRLMVYVRGPVAGANAWVVDYADISAVVRPRVVDVLDHTDLNAVICPSTAENLAAWVWAAVAPHLPGLCAVEVYETATTVVRYEGD